MHLDPPVRRPTRPETQGTVPKRRVMLQSSDEEADPIALATNLRRAIFDGAEELAPGLFAAAETRRYVLCGLAVFEAVFAIDLQANKRLAASR